MTGVQTCALPICAGVLVDSPMNQVFAYLDDPANADVFVEAVRYRRADK